MEAVLIIGVVVVLAVVVLLVIPEMVMTMWAEFAFPKHPDGRFPRARRIARVLFLMFWAAVIVFLFWWQWSDIVAFCGELFR